MGRNVKTALSAIFVVALVVSVCRLPTIKIGLDANAKPTAPVDKNPPVVRAPDVGPRVVAGRGTCELAGVRVRVTEVWVSRGIDDGAVRWGNVPTAMWMKVRLEYQYLTADSEATYYWWNKTTAQATALYDAKDRKYQGVHGNSFSQEQTRQLLKQGLTRPTEETIYLEAPEPGSPYYDLDLVPDHLPPGQKYQFRIPAVMVEWGTKN